MAVNLEALSFNAGEFVGVKSVADSFLLYTRSKQLEYDTMVTADIRRISESNSVLYEALCTKFMQKLEAMKLIS